MNFRRIWNPVGLRCPICYSWCRVWHKINLNCGESNVIVIRIRDECIKIYAGWGWNDSHYMTMEQHFSSQTHALLYAFCMEIQFSLCLPFNFNAHGHVIFEAFLLLLRYNEMLVEYFLFLCHKGNGKKAGLKVEENTEMFLIRGSLILHSS